MVPAHPFDLSNRTLLFTPDGNDGYTRAVLPLDWDPNDHGERHWRTTEIEMQHFEFEFSGRAWRSFHLSVNGHIAFGDASAKRDLVRFGTMQMYADAIAMSGVPMISALYKPHLSGWKHVADLPDRVVITFYAQEYLFAPHGRGTAQTFDLQVVLHSDGRIAFNYGPDPMNPDERIRDGVVGLFPVATPAEGHRISSTGPTDLSNPDPQATPRQVEVFRYDAIRDRGEGIADVSCRIIEVLGDEFDFFAFNSQSRVDQQETGPAHGFGGFYRANINAEVDGIGLRSNRPTTPCETRLKNTWGFPTWIKARTVRHEDHARSGQRTPYDSGLTYFAHEIGHTWTAYAVYQMDGGRIPLSDGAHWADGLHNPAAFSPHGDENGSVMGGAFWHEFPDGSFRSTSGWGTRAGGFSWLDLYLMGLATPDEVPDMFILRNLQPVSDRQGDYVGVKEVITVEQVIAATGVRKPPTGTARTVFDIGFAYFLLPGESVDPELLREHAEYRDRAVDHWHHITGGRGQLNATLP